MSTIKTILPTQARRVRRSRFAGNERALLVRALEKQAESNRSNDRKGRAEEIYLIAEWKAKEYSIEYELGGGVNEDNKNSYTVEDDDFLLIAPSRNGYAFDGWYFEEDYSGNKVEK